MPTLLRIIRSLGPEGAVANAAQLLEQRHREVLVVEALARRIAPALPPAPAVAVVAAAA